MTSSSFLKTLAVTFVVTLVGDIAWHNWALHDFYDDRIAAINGGPSTMAGFPMTLVVFELVVSAITVYVVRAAAKTRTLGEGAFHGALIGLATAGAVNFVNHSLLDKWDMTIVLVDTAWGIALGAVCGYLVAWMAKKGW